MAKTPKSDRSDGIWWLIIIGGFIVGAWPVSVILIILKSVGTLPNLMSLFERITGKKRPGADRTGWQARDYAAASPGFDPNARPQTPDAVQQQAQCAAQSAVQQTGKKKANPSRPGGFAKALTVLGIILIIIGLCQFAGSEVVWDIRNGRWEWLPQDVFAYAHELVQAAGWTAGGLVSLVLGRSQKKKRLRYEQYTQLIGENDFLPIDSIADATGRPYNKILADLQDMIDRGYLPGAWIDMKHRRLMLTEMQIEPEPEPAPAPPQPETPPPAETVSESEKILRQIRCANDLIADPEISRKIDRIESLTAKIFRCLEEQPEKREQLTTFLGYYLPQTLKILETYARLENQGIEGKNIAAAKQRISGMLDKLADGYEKQLDRLFTNDVLDITTDIAVMEQMLAKDGLGEEELKPEKETLHF